MDATKKKEWSFGSLMINFIVKMAQLVQKLMALSLGIAMGRFIAWTAQQLFGRMEVRNGGSTAIGTD
jgi:hypothetical protein